MENFRAGGAVKRGIIFSVAATLIVAAGCATGRRGEPFTRDPQLKDAQLALGQRVFYRNCNVCHPAGSAGYGPSLVDQAYLPGWEITFQVRNGLGAMPPFDENRLPQAELDAVVRYIETLRAL